MFIDREEELGELLKLIRFEPNVINFVYGPMNSGKTALMLEFLKRLPQDHVGFYVNFRATPVSSYEEFSRVLFSTEYGGIKKTIKEIVKGLAKINTGIPIPQEILEVILKEKEPINAFSYLKDLMLEIIESGKRPVLVFDEIQVIKDLKVDDPLIYQLFNFLIHLTKEIHLAHVFVVTSDSLFIGEVYGNAKLTGRAEYFPVYDLSREASMELLRTLGVSGEEAELLWEYFGGKPGYLIEGAKRKGKVREWCELKLRLRIREIRKFKDYKILDKFLEREEVEVEELGGEEKELIKENVLFYDPLKGTLSPQGRLELLAIRSLKSRAPSSPSTSSAPR
ncbi:ATP-binding protein [Pyrococcus kukulkanii]|uniref:ATP-binding protein n=1 Tax=Pyrococcus kukulkanii TaxID=1609559 RepID=UPI00356A2463